MQVRQGDVFLIKIEKLPTKLQKKDNILALGEVTGHKHSVQGSVQVFKNPTTNVQYVEGEGVLTHDEHGKIAIPKGTYEVRIQREYSPQETRQVMD